MKDYRQNTTTGKNPVLTGAKLAWLMMVIVVLILPGVGLAEWIPYTVINSPLETDYLISLEVGPDGKLLIGSQGHGLYVKDADAWNNFDEDNTGVPINYVRGLKFDYDTLFVGSASGDLDNQPLGEGLSILNLTDSTWLELNMGLEINHIITGIEITPEYRAVSTYGGGVTVFGPEEWTRYQREFRTEFSYADSQQQTFVVEPGTYIPTDYLLGLDYDPQNDVLWIATLDGGAVSFSDSVWQTYDMQNSGLPSNRIQLVKVSQDASRVYFGTYGFGLAQKDSAGWVVYNTGNSPLVSDFVYSLEVRPDNGDLWIGTNYAISVLSVDGLWNSYVPPDSNLIWGDFYSDIAFDSSSNVWVATFGGGIAQKSLEEQPPPEDSLSIDLNKLKFFLRYPERNDITWLNCRVEPLVELGDEDSVSITVDSELGRVYAWESSFAQLWHVFHVPNIDWYVAMVDGSVVSLKYKHNQGRIRIRLLDWNYQINRDNFAQEVDLRIRLGDYVGVGHVTLWQGDPWGDPDADTLDFGDGDLLYSSEFIPTSIDDEEPVLVPENMALPINYPNPFNSGTSILFTTAQEGMVRLSVVDILGRVVSVDERYCKVGLHSFIWDGSSHATGVYYYILNIGDKRLTGRMTLLK